MYKKILANWHYRIKARVVDGALLAKFDTAIEPVLLRLDLTRVQANTLSVRAVDGDYELGLSGYKMEFVPLARFEVRDAAEAAQRSIERALYCGMRTRRFRGALAATLGVMAGIVLSLVVALTLFGNAIGGSDMVARMSTPAASMAGMGAMGSMDPAMLQAIEQQMRTGAGMAAGAGGAANIPDIGMLGMPQAPAPATPGEPMSADDFLNQK